MDPAATAAATAKATDLLIMQYGLAGIVILALAVVVVVLWRQNNALTKKLMELAETGIRAIERQTATGETLVAMRDRSASMAEETNRAILTLASLNERESERTRETLERFGDACEKLAENCNKLISAMMNRPGGRG